MKGGSDAPALTAQIKKVATIKELLHTHRTHAGHFNCIHLSACWISLGRLAREGAAQQKIWCGSQ